MPITLNSDLSDYIIIVGGSVSGQSVPANTNLNVAIPIDVPSGYKLIGDAGYFIDNHIINVSGTRIDPGNNYIHIESRNMSATNYSNITYYVRAICKKII